METILREHGHHVPAGEALELLGSDAEGGLQPFEVERRRARFGANAIARRRTEGPLRRFAEQFQQPLVIVLLVAAIVTLSLGEWVDAGVVLGVVLVNAVVGFVQEAKALASIEALAKSLDVQATVVRAGEVVRVPAVDLVPGDVVLIQSGDKVPGDLRLIRARELRVDESALTGESLPVEKDPEATLTKDTPIAERANMAFASTLVAHGAARGVVVATGAGTEIGKISRLVATAEALATPLTRKIRTFSHVLLIAILVLATIAFGLGIARGRPLLEVLMAAVALAVGAIPEGLPAAVTVILAIGVARMARRRAIVRRLPAVEALGSTTVICSDKTGTLTRNEMTVQRLATVDEWFDVTGVGYAPEGALRRNDEPVTLADRAGLEALLTCGVACNDADVVRGGDTWTAAGDPTEAALVVAGEKTSLRAVDTRKKLRRIDAIPFESHRQWMATLHEGEERPVVYVKGSVERILERCVRARTASGEVVPLERSVVEHAAESFAGDGLRVLAFATKTLPAGTATLDEEDVDELQFLGLQAMIDPPRPEAIRAVASCHRAGIDVKMITGDHASTARAIARQLGIVPRDAEKPVVLAGRELHDLPDRALVDRVEGVSVFARVSPEDKLRIVEALSARGHVVAMTGDGVNDAPALRRADIGIAMGKGGTEVAREASDIVLTDDDFASIEAAVQEGRGVFDNLMKFIVWTLPTNGGEALVLLLAIALGLPLPILPVQILWINMTTAVFLGLMLAFEPKEEGLMDRPPRAPGTPILSGRLVSRIVLVSVLLTAISFALFHWELRVGGSEAQARSVAASALVFGELFYLFNCRSLERSVFSVGLWSNRLVWVGITVMTVAQVAFVHAPLFNRAFETAPIGLASWVRIVLAGVLVFVVVAIEKALARRIVKPGPAAKDEPGTLLTSS